MKDKRDWLINIRVQQGFTQQKVEDESLVDRSTYAQYESGRRTPTVENAKKIGKALGFDWTIFFANESGIKPQTKSA